MAGRIAAHEGAVVVACCIPAGAAPGMPLDRAPWPALGLGRWGRALLVMALAGVGFVSCPTLGAESGEYAERFGRASELERQGSFTAAAAELEALLGDYPDDYALELQLGWLRYRADQPERAEQHYRRAVALSGGAKDARLGLAWCLLEQGDAPAARPIFEALVSESPGLVSARDGLALIRREYSPVARLGGAYVHHSDHPFRRSGWAIRIGGDVPIGRLVLVSGTFRFARLTNTDSVITGTTTNPGGGPGPGGPGGPGGTAFSTRVSGSYDQPELHLAAGVRKPRWGLSAHFAYLNDRGEFDDNLFAIGATGHYSRLGDLWLEASVSFYPDATVMRISPWWLIELGRGFYVRPGGSVQLADGGQWLGSYFAEVGVAGSHGALFLGGRGGRERRPTYLLVPLMLNIAEDLSWGAWAGGALRMNDRVELRAVYQVDNLEPVFESVRRQSYMHTVALSLGFWL